VSTGYRECRKLGSKNLWRHFFGQGRGRLSPTDPPASCWASKASPTGFVELTVRKDRPAPPGILLHVTETLPKSDCAKFEPFTLTNVTRTCIDLGAVVDEEVVEMAMEDALRTRRTSLDKLWRRTEALVCKDPLPFRQFVVRRTDGMFIARVDLAYPEIKLAIECDSYKFHSGRRAWEKDRKRGNPLVAAGWGTLRATWSDLEDPAEFLQTLSDAFSSGSGVGFRR
jgi:very-short-patch-repair endonuclease